MQAQVGVVGETVVTVEELLQHVAQQRRRQVLLLQSLQGQVQP